ncbi:uncharacterized protein [Clytia hemisphaerica]|uniref:Uncharacterized protein n=1 Tax=Clytia hemisphaerica TaxID=252671 RepID=A0A7M5U5C4_9CNID
MSSLLNKELGIAAGIAVTSFVAGNLAARYMSATPTPPKEQQSAKQDNLKKSRTADEYVEENSLREPAVLKELREYTFKNVPMAKMVSDPCQIQFFRLLLNMLDAKKCIEVGTYTGYNVLSTALTIPSDGVIYALDVNEDYVKEGYPFFEKAGVKDKIVVKIGPAVESLDELISKGETETFDFIYVDADKISYEKYLDRAILLLKSGGILAFDNMLQGGLVLDLTQEMTPEQRHSAEFLYKLNQKLKLDNRFQLSFLNIADGVTLCRKL